MERSVSRRFDAFRNIGRSERDIAHETRFNAIILSPDGTFDLKDYKFLYLLATLKVFF